MFISTNSEVKKVIENWDFLYLVLQGISSQTVISNLALLTISILIFANIFSPTCS